MVDASVLLQQVTDELRSIPSAHAHPPGRRETDSTGVTERLREVWGDTSFSLGDSPVAGIYRDRFSGVALKTPPRDSAPALPACEPFAAFPVALLEREEGAP